MTPRAALTVHPLAEEDYAAWAVGAVSRLAEQRTVGGTHDRSAAQQTASEIVASRLTEGLRTPGQHVFQVFSDGVPIGHAWMSAEAGGAAFLYDLDPAARTTELLAAGEVVARGHGAAQMQINVFAHERALDAATVACGYVPSATQMRLRLPAQRRKSAASAVSLVRMTEESFDEFVLETVAAYAEDLIQSRLAAAADALARSRAEVAEMLPAGIGTPGQHLLDVVGVDGTSVGTLWLSIAAPSAFVADLTIHLDMRRRGYGRAAMLAAETYCAVRGCNLMRLSVFGFNTAARNLYDRLGYVRVEELRHKPLAGT